MHLRVRLLSTFNVDSIPLASPPNFQDRKPIAPSSAYKRVVFGATADKKTLKKFTEITTPLVETIMHNAIEISNLSDLRDSLLPRLMTGKIRVRM